MNSRRFEASLFSIPLAIPLASLLLAGFLISGCNSDVQRSGQGDQNVTVRPDTDSATQSGTTQSGTSRDAQNVTVPEQSQGNQAGPNSSQPNTGDPRTGSDISAGENQSIDETRDTADRTSSGLDATKEVRQGGYTVPRDNAATRDPASAAASPSTKDTPATHKTPHGSK